MIIFKYFIFLLIKIIFINIQIILTNYQKLIKKKLYKQKINIIIFNQIFFQKINKKIINIKKKNSKKKMENRNNTNSQNPNNPQQNPQRRTVENLVGIVSNLSEGERDTRNFQQINGQTLYTTVLINNVNMEFKDIVKMAGTKSKIIDLIKSQGLILPTYGLTIDQLVHNWIKRFWVNSLDKAPKNITRKNCVKVLQSNQAILNANVRISDGWNADFLKDMAFTMVPNHPCWSQNRYDFSRISTHTQVTVGQTESIGLGDLNLPDTLFQNIANTRTTRIQNAFSQAILDVRQQNQQSQPTQQEFNQNVPQQNQINNNQNNQQNNQQQEEPSIFLDYDGNFSLQDGENLTNCPICLVSDDRLHFLRCCGGPMHQDCLHHNLNSSRRCPFCRASDARLQRRPLRRSQAIVSNNNNDVPQQEEQKNQNNDADDEGSINPNNVLNQSQDI